MLQPFETVYTYEASSGTSSRQPSELVLISSTSSDREPALILLGLMGRL